jgi:hypothetical protein
LTSLITDGDQGGGITSGLLPDTPGTGPKSLDRKKDPKNTKKGHERRLMVTVSWPIH